MSLFKLKEVWTKPPESSKQYLPTSFCIVKSGSYSLILCASVEGVIKVLNPERSPPNDELVEYSVGSQIHQISYGHYVSSSTHSQLCVLCPNAVKIFYLTVNLSEAQMSNPVSFELAYAHSLERFSFNMACGPFGKGNSGRDFICVQSLDGFLSIFEQETRGMSACLPDFLLPSSLLYLESSDSFVTSNFSQTVFSFKYANLTSDQSGKKLKPEWTYNAGENICDLRSMIYEYCQPSVLGLGERTIFCLSDSGSPRFIKKLDCTPICFHPYASLAKVCINYMVATTNSSLLVLQDQKLKWTSQLPLNPCYLTTLDFNGVQNYIFAASSSGNLYIGYLGTDPDMTSFVTRIESRSNESYEVLQSQLSGVRSSISGRQLGVEQRDDSNDQIKVVVQVASALDATSKVRGSNVPSISVAVLLSSKVALSDIEVVVSPTPPVAAVQAQFNLMSIGGGKSEDSNKVDFTFYVLDHTTPSTLWVPLSVSYKTSSGRPRITKAMIKLPFNLCCIVCEPKKTQEHKLTVDTNRPPTPVAALYRSLFPNQIESEGSNAIAFQFFSGAVVTILAASKSNRYRFQSDHFEAIWITLDEFTQLVSSSESNQELSYSGQIPIHELLAAVEMHCQLRINLTSISDMIFQRSAQFRVIQKRLLAKYKEKNADSLMNMDALLDGTYRQLYSLGEAAEEIEDQLKVSGSKLSSVAKLVCHLCKLLKNMSEDEMQTMDLAFSHSLLFSNPLDQGWEEHANAAITHLLKTTMSKDPREDNAQVVSLEKYPSPEKLLKHVKIFIERVLKGAMPGGSVASSFSSHKSQSAKSSVMATVPKDSPAILEEEEEENGGSGEQVAVGDQAREVFADGDATVHRPQRGSSMKVLNGLEHFDFSSEL